MQINHQLLANLIDDLEQAGCTVPYADRYRALASTSEPDEPDAVLLNLTPAELQQLALRRAQHRLASTDARNSTRSHLGELKSRVASEMAVMICDNADKLIRQLRPAFDRLAESARQVRSLGVQPGDRAEQLLDKGDRAITAWQEFRRVHAPAIQDLATLRIRMSEVAGVPPVHDPRLASGHERVDYGICFSRPRAAYSDTRAGETVHDRWLRLAPNLHLTTSDEYTQVDLLAAIGADTSRIQAEAAARVLRRRANLEPSTH